MAEECARHGAQLVICARQPGPLEQARRKLVEQGAEVLALPCDVSDQKQVTNLVEQAIAHFGRIDVLINNAGIITVGPLPNMTEQDFANSMNIMFWGTLYPTLAVLPHMRAQQHGHIVNITSIGGKISVPHLLPYNSAKFAALGFSEGLHAELAKEHIYVTSVVPGLMRTGSHINAFVKGKHQAEYTLFGLLATLPLTSTSAASAARQIVRATCRGDAELIITPHAKLLARFHGLLPGTSTRLLSLVDRMLPRADEQRTERKSGRASRSGLSAWLTRAGEPAAHAYNQYSKQGG